ncbi:hypothetical protein JCM10212_005817 [Sporobolomyces blumeae]
MARRRKCTAPFVMNPLTPPYSSPESADEASSAHPLACYSPQPPLRSYKFRTCPAAPSHYPEAKRPRSSASNEPHLPRPVALANPHDARLGEQSFCPTPALTPEQVVPAASTGGLPSHFDALHAPASSSSGAAAGARTFVKRDDLTQKAVARAQSIAQNQSLQAEKDRFVNGLVGASVLAIESIWGPSTPASSSSSTTHFATPSTVLPLAYFVREVLRRSRTSCSTLQLSLYYLHKCRREIRDAVHQAESSRIEIAQLAAMGGSDSVDAAAAAAVARDEAAVVDSFVSPVTKRSYEGDAAYPSPPDSPAASPPGPRRASPSSLDATESLGDRFTRLLSYQKSPLLCGRRMFLASLISASKYLQDRNYSNKAWAKISGLDVGEINENERAFLKVVGWEVHLHPDDFKRWTDRLSTLTTTSQCPALSSSSSSSSPSPCPDAASSAASVPDASSRFGLSRSASEYLPAGPSTVALASSCSTASSNVVRRKLALVRGHSAPQLDPSASASSALSAPTGQRKAARGAFPIAQPIRAGSPRSRSTTLAILPSSSLPSSSTASSASSASPVAVPTTSVRVEANEGEGSIDATSGPASFTRKVRALPVRRSKPVGIASSSLSSTASIPDSRDAGRAAYWNGGASGGNAFGGIGFGPAGEVVRVY